jgi:hypothetical protein
MIYLPNNVFTKDYVELHRQLARGNRSPRTPYRCTPDLLQLLTNKFVWQGKIARLSTLIVGTQQVQEINDMQRVITR